MRLLIFSIFVLSQLSISAQGLNSELLETVFQDSTISAYLESNHKENGLSSLLGDSNHELILVDEGVYITDDSSDAMHLIGVVGRNKVTKSKAIIKIYLNESQTQYLRLKLRRQDECFPWFGRSCLIVQDKYNKLGEKQNRIYEFYFTNT